MTVTAEPEGITPMNVVSVFDESERNKIYSVSLKEGVSVDVKVNPETGLFYVMENADGSTVYDSNNSEITFPDFSYDEASVLSFVKIIHELGILNNPIVYDRSLAERDGLKNLVDVLTPQETADLLGKAVQDGCNIHLPGSAFGSDECRDGHKLSLKEQIQIAQGKTVASDAIEQVHNVFNR